MTSDASVYVVVGERNLLAGRLYRHRRRGVESATNCSTPRAGTVSSRPAWRYAHGCGGRRWADAIWQSSQWPFILGTYGEWGLAHLRALVRGDALEQLNGCRRPGRLGPARAEAALQDHLAVVGRRAVSIL
jgi:hypothetical protein